MPSNVIESVNHLHPGADDAFRQPPTLELESSIDLNGRPSVERLTVEGNTLFVRSLSSHRCRDWPLNVFADFRLCESIGSSFLQARCESRWIDILRLPGRGVPVERQASSTN